MKKYIFSKGSALMTVVVATLTLSSCEYKNLGDEESYSKKKTKFMLVFDWDKVDSIPQSMRVVFYPHDLSQYAQGYTTFDVLNRDTTIELPAGIYDVTAWNNDTEHVITSTYAKQESTYATTGNYSPHGDVNMPKVLENLYHDQKVLDYPDYMVHAVANNYHEIEIETGESKTIKIFPDSMVVKVNFKLKEIKGLDWVRECRGSLNNVAGKRYITPDNVTEDSVAVMFDCNFNPEENTVYGSFYVFGLYPSNSTIVLSHKMVMYFWMNKGQVFLPIDVTEVINKAGREGNDVTIEINNLDINLKDYVSSPNTFDINVDEWTDVNVEVGF